jgi:transposase
MAGEIISERRATPNRNGGRDHPGFPGDFRRNPQPMLAARQALQLQYQALDAMVLQAVRADQVCCRLLTVPGVGAVTALVFATAIDDPAHFVCSRDVGPISD